MHLNGHIGLLLIINLAESNGFQQLDEELCKHLPADLFSISLPAIYGTDYCFKNPLQRWEPESHFRKDPNKHWHRRQRNGPTDMSLGRLGRYDLQHFCFPYRLQESSIFRMPILHRNRSYGSPVHRGVRNDPVSRDIPVLQAALLQPVREYWSETLDRNPECIPGRPPHGHLFRRSHDVLGCLPLLSSIYVTVAGQVQWPRAQG